MTWIKLRRCSRLLLSLNSILTYTILLAGPVVAERVVGFLPSMCKTLIYISGTGEKDDVLAGSYYLDVYMSQLYN